MKQAFRVLQIAFTYIGTVVGAGFATGQEILQFFTQYGKWATITIGLSTMLFVWLGTKMMLIAHDTGSRSYEDLNKHLFGHKAGKWITWVTLLILIGVNSVMLAGAGSVFVEHLGLHYQTGLIVTLVGTYLLLGRGIQAILQMNSIVVPMMLLLSLLMITSTIHHPGASRFITLTTDSNPIQVWLSPLLYTSFNLVLAQAVLVPVGNQIRSRNVLKWGGSGWNWRWFHADGSSFCHVSSDARHHPIRNPDGQHCLSTWMGSAICICIPYFHGNIHYLCSRYLWNDLATETTYTCPSPFHYINHYAIVLLTQPVWIQFPAVHPLPHLWKYGINLGCQIGTEPLGHLS